LKAIDLFAGIGGWSLGLEAAGINVVQSYEKWPDAVATYNANLFTDRAPIDVHDIDLGQLPRDIDLVVGSPPCTEFSFSNRGGNGDLTKGLREIARFLEIVERFKPRYWILENVPRTARLVEEALGNPRHSLYRYRHLRPSFHVLDLSDFGLPQARRRCLIGQFPFDQLDKYKQVFGDETLGHVVAALGSVGKIKDPVCGGAISHERLTEMEPEPPLDKEQLRMNREAKRFHPVYNDMAFPDRLDAPARTITATCSRVSRESIVIRDEKDRCLRRLTIRERASLQGFPITFQFRANSYSSKLTMVGNAMPPSISFLLGMAARKASTVDVQKRISSAAIVEKLSIVTPPEPVPVHNVGEKYARTRRFRAALPGLRFKSGMRFELANAFNKNRRVRWRVGFFHGPSTAIRSVQLNARILKRIRRVAAVSKIMPELASEMQGIRRSLLTTSPALLQRVWSRRSEGLGPFEITDLLGRTAAKIAKRLRRVDSERLAEAVYVCCGPEAQRQDVSGKLARNARAILAGFITGTYFNLGCCRGWHTTIIREFARNVVSHRLKSTIEPRLKVSRGRSGICSVKRNAA
jgi:DNA (cytosine-5)-methyltransferase 1